MELLTRSIQWRISPRGRSHRGRRRVRLLITSPSASSQRPFLRPLLRPNNKPNIPYLPLPHQLFRSLQQIRHLITHHLHALSLLPISTNLKPKPRPSLQLKSPMKNITCVIALHSLCSGGNRRKARPRALSFNSFSLNGDRARERRKSSIQPTSRTNELVKCLARAAAFPMSPRLSSTVRVCCFDLMTAYVVQRTGATCCHQVGPGSAASSLPLNRG